MADTVQVVPPLPDKGEIVSNAALYNTQIFNYRSTLAFGGIRNPSAVWSSMWRDDSSAMAYYRELESKDTAGLSATTLESYLPWILTPPAFHTYRTTQVSSANCEIENLSGNTVQRDGSTIFASQEFTGALFFYRLWKGDCEYALYSFMGSVVDPQVDADGDSITLGLRTFCNWSAIKAPPYQIGVSCGLQFASGECASTSATPCNNSYGTCTSPERFKGVVLEWNGASLDYTQNVQPAPLRLANPVRAY